MQISLVGPPATCRVSCWSFCQYLIYASNLKKKPKQPAQKKATVELCAGIIRFSEQQLCDFVFLQAMISFTHGQNGKTGQETPPTMRGTQTQHLRNNVWQMAGMYLHLDYGLFDYLTVSRWHGSAITQLMPHAHGSGSTRRSLSKEAEEAPESTGSSCSKLRWDDTRVNFQMIFPVWRGWKASSALCCSCRRRNLQAATRYGSPKDASAPNFYSHMAGVIRFEGHCSQPSRS